jgi:hypothetical protein
MPLPVPAAPSPSGGCDPREGRGWLLAFAVAVPLAYAVAFAAFSGRVGRMDHDQFLVFTELQHWNVRLFGFARQWSPVLCGGLSIAADPQVPFLSPAVVLSFLLGPFLGLRAATIAWLAVGWIGGYAYAGLWRRDVVVRSLAASLFVGNGFFVMRLRHGHLDLVPMLSLPLVLWALHRRSTIGRVFGGSRRGGVALTLALGGVVALAVDGAPVTIIHWLLWLGVYALALAFVERRAGPLVLLAAAIPVASLLDAGYLWPMLAGQQEFPRSTADAFTSPLSLLWFLVVPGGGKVVPAPALGHELTVWVGPVVLWAIARNARGFARSLPRELALPLAATAAVSFVLGMGSLAAAGWPWFLSPFDLLRPLPGFRSIGVTGRYWGFLALPLALAGAAGLVDLVERHPRRWLVRAGLAGAIVLQVGFQASALASAFAGSRPYAAVPVAFGGTVDYVLRGRELQGALITPSRGVIDCYDNGDFVRPTMARGEELVREVRREGEPFPQTAFRAEFLGWSRIVLTPAVWLPAGRWRVELNQAHHRLWHASRGTVLAGDTGNLVLDWSGGAGDSAVALEFRDDASALGARVSLAAWPALLALLTLLAGASRTPVATGREP